MKKILFATASFFFSSLSFANTAVDVSDFPPGWRGGIICSAQNVSGQTFTANGIYSEPRSAVEVQEQAMMVCGAMSDRKNCWPTGCRKATLQTNTCFKDAVQHNSRIL